jgi:pyruvate kinase
MCGSMHRDRAGLAALSEALTTLRLDALRVEAQQRPMLDALPPQTRASGSNLTHYLALRRRDLRELQGGLAERGLSSLGRAEPHVLATLDAVLGALDAPPSTPGGLGFAEGRQRLVDNANALLGPTVERLPVRIMVTAPTEAATDPQITRDLLAAGMSVLRINCAHDSRTVWSAMVDNLRAAERAVGRSCKILCDLGGPKLRTGALAPGPQVLRVRVRKDALGRPTEASRVFVGQRVPTSALPWVPVDARFAAELEPGDELRLVDARGKKRSLTVVERRAEGAVVETLRGLYVTPGMSLELLREGKRRARSEVGPLPSAEQPIRLRVGDLLQLSAEPILGGPTLRDADGRVCAPARVALTRPDAVRALRVGQAVVFDDGRAHAVVRRLEPRWAELEITQTVEDEIALRADKGVNLPDTQLPFPALTEQDLEDLDFVVDYADVVGLSFVRGRDDVELLHHHLDRRGASALGVVLKIETQQGFQRLPEILLTALRRPGVGVMVARGDLGVEVGFERLAELQEEILWLCEAAHVPAVWATQVLDSMAKTGTPSRAEVTDAAMAGRAECVMLNKGPHIADTVRFLGDVLERMSAHQHKKISTLRRLEVSELGAHASS